MSRATVQQRGATKAQLAHRAQWLRLEVHEEIGLFSRTLDTAHAVGSPKALAVQLGNDLLDVMLEAGL